VGSAQSDANEDNGRWGKEVSVSRRVPEMAGHDIRGNAGVLVNSEGCRRGKFASGRAGTMKNVGKSMGFGFRGGVFSSKVSIANKSDASPGIFRACYVVAGRIPSRSKALDQRGHNVR
jgi:hypothetical protein